MVSDDNKRVSVTLPKEMLDFIDARRRWQSRSSFIYKAVWYYLREKYDFGKKGG